MGNQRGVWQHCAPGDEFLCEAGCLIFPSEQGAYAQLFSIAARPVAAADQVLTVDHLKDLVRGEDVHNPRTTLLCLENTHNRGGGKVLPYETVADVCRWAKERGLARHLDGARLFNAVVASGIAADQWARHFDTVSVCFSKGLGAPIGSALCGSREAIERARRLRKALGGGWRQAGLLAAAALYALDHNIERLGEDHANARVLADAVQECEGLELDPPDVETNIVIFKVDEQLGPAEEFCGQLKKRGVLMSVNAKHKVRAVTHLDVSSNDARSASESLLNIARDART
jgi:threonine aldolase